jgi:hypothetical protein
MEVILKLNTQEKVTALGELLIVAAKSEKVNEKGMTLALLLLEDLKAAVAAVNAAHDAPTPAPAEATEEGHA